MWALDDYLVPYLTMDEIEAGAEALLEKYYPEALGDLKMHKACVLAERMGLSVMTLPLYKRPKTKSILFFCESEISVCLNQEDQCSGPASCRSVQAAYVDEAQITNNSHGATPRFIACMKVL